MAAQKATELRRLVEAVEINEAGLRSRQAELEAQLIAVPASTWQEAADKARYLLRIPAVSPAGEDPRRRRLINAVLDDFDRLGQSAAWSGGEKLPD
jgi:hypothetical protein